MSSPRVQPRRGACGVGSRRATAVAAACFAMLAFPLALPAQAAAYACGDGSRGTNRTGELSRVSPDECGAGDSLRGGERQRRRADARGVAVFVLAVAGALLVPIGEGGIRHGGDPFGRARDDNARK